MCPAARKCLIFRDFLAGRDPATTAAGAWGAHWAPSGRRQRAGELGRELRGRCGLGELGRWGARMPGA